ncbi:aromatic acid exporter family protein [Corticibacter populi]|uniref:Aromatic acid exporter family protein n=1 Tax=Corticibacter populi TaxID=1550736 RepID=A0A3M6QYJ1_9BURK|nr:FUSC family protein [Corticibacter populi]RMX07991.1 aromatic acid exporter family protein [Corticibacter populi]RZS35233.1 uncharacterized membrane protein YgaE (UPF0421/DUF939 family) [Corticibacter populi]
MRFQSIPSISKLRFRKWLPTWQQRVRLALRDAVGCALAAVIAWQFAALLWGHARPTFAAVTAVVCLAPGVPSHLKQTWSLLLGCTVGILVGELAWQLPEHHPMLRLGLMVFVALLLGCLFGPAPVVPIQSGISVLLVLAMGPAVAGEVRLLDVFTGAVVGVFFSQVLFTSDPLRDMSRAAGRFLGQLGDGLQHALQAVAGGRATEAERALGAITRAHEGLAALQTAVAQGQSAVKWSLRGRLDAVRVTAVTRRYDRHAVRLYAATLLLGESLVRTLGHQSGAMPETLRQRCEWLVQALAGLAKDADVIVLDPSARLPSLPQAHAGGPMAPVPALPPEWQPVDEYCEQARQALVALLGSRDG